MENKETELDFIKSRLNFVEEKLKEKEKPWYKQPTTLVAVLAFILSVVTTTVSYIGSIKKAEDQKRETLRNHIDYLLEIPLKQSELQVALIDRQDYLYQALTTLNDMTVVRANLAKEIINDLGVETFTSQFLLSISYSLLSSARYRDAEFFADNALKNSESSLDSVAAYKMLGKIYYSRGELENGRINYTKVEEMLKKEYEGIIYYLPVAVGLHYFEWAVIESTYDPQKANELSEQAKVEYSKIPPSPSKQQIFNILNSYGILTNQD